MCLFEDREEEPRRGKETEHSGDWEINALEKESGVVTVLDD